MAEDDPYQVLGVADGVSPADLKKAYYRKIREHPPETDPDGFQRVQRAYQTATDPEYPIRRQHGKEIDTLMAEADQLMEKKEFSAAIRPLKRVLVLNPNSDQARELLGVCQTLTAQWDDAKRTYARLVGQKPESVQYRVGYARVFIQQANSIERDPAAEAQLAGEARTHLDEAWKLDSDSAAVMRAYSKSYDVQADWPRAIEWGEKAAARGSLDIDDYTYLVRLHALADRIPGVTEVADRLADRLNDEGQKKAGVYFANEASEFYDRHLFILAHALIIAADRLNPDDPNISSFCDRLANAAEAKEEFQRLKNDKEMNPAVRGFCAVYLDQALGSEFDEPIGSILDKLKAALDTWEVHEISSAARRVQRKYSAVYRLNPDLFDTLAGEKARKSARGFPSRPRRPVASTPTREPVRAPSPPPPPVRPPAPPLAPPVVDPFQHDHWERPADREPAKLAPHRGGIILTLGLLSLFCCCFPSGLFALGLGSRDLERMNRGEMNPEGKGMSIAGMVLSVIGLFVSAILIIAQLAK
jgi:tetratricopeptide (TPR) repeat protein